MKTLRISLLCLVLVVEATTAWAQIKVENAWVRATVPKQQATGAFMKITSVEAVKLMAVNTTVAKTN